MNTTTAIGIILVTIGFILIVPFILIWAINGLFSLHIAYTWENWFYVLVIKFLTLRWEINKN
jgi:hypothetical protein